MSEKIQPLVVAIILNYNSSVDCSICIECLKKQDYSNLKLLVVDNASCEDEIIKLELLCKKENIPLVKNNINIGFAAGNNVGLRKATKLEAEYALIINPDVQIRSVDYLSYLVRKMQSDRRIVVSAGDMVGLDNEHQNPRLTISFFEEFFWPLSIVKKYLTNRSAVYGNWKDEGVCYKLAGGCMLLDMNFVEMIGYLDEGTFLYLEETILAHQVKINGKVMYYSPKVTVLHAHKKTTGKASLWQMQQLWKSQDYYYEKYKPYVGLKKILILFSNKIYRILMTRKLEKRI